MGKKRITFVLSNLGQGGSERQMVNLSRAISKEGYSVDLLTYYSSDFFGLTNNKDGVNYIDLKTNSKFNRIKKIRGYYKNNRPDIIITLVDTPALYALISSVGLKNKIILTWRNNNEQIFDSVILKVADCFKRKIKGIVFNSAKGKNIWIEHRPKDSKKTHIIYNLVNPVGISEHEKSSFKEKRIVVAARVVWDKNADGLLRAIDLLSEEDKRMLKIDWYGRSDDSGEYYQSVVALSEELGLKDIVSFHEAVSNINEKISYADAVGLFSHREGFPNALCEGMQIGKPIIMTPVSDYRVLVDGNGFVSRSDSAQDISKTLYAFLHCSESELEKMGNRSSIIFQKILNNKENINKWIRLIEE